MRTDGDLILRAQEHSPTSFQPRTFYSTSCDTAVSSSTCCSSSRRSHIPSSRGSSAWTLSSASRERLRSFSRKAGPSRLATSGTCGARQRSPHHFPLLSLLPRRDIGHVRRHHARCVGFCPVRKGLGLTLRTVAQAGDRKTVSAQIGLSPDQRQKLLDAKCVRSPGFEVSSDQTSHRASPSNPQYQLRMFCCTDQYYTPQSTYGYNRGQHVPASQPRGPAPVDFPAACEVKVNAINIGSHKIRGVKKKEGSIMPPDITPQAHLPVGTVNRIEIVYINTEKVRLCCLRCLPVSH